MNSKEITIGISSCLLGEKVRYDGDHKKNNFILSHLSDEFQFKGFCPEMGIGLGTPRPPIHIRKVITQELVVQVNDPNTQFTKDLTKYAYLLKPELDKFCGIIFKSKSPSCGVKSTPLHDQKGNALSEVTSGAFAKKVLELYPYLPFEEENHLISKTQIENFKTRVYIYSHWKSLLSSSLNNNKLAKQHLLTSLKIKLEKIK